ncbi:polysaccharide pyruvyl transferase family protein [Micromonospora sp. NBC_01739]|uniref:polysaccharide pyruvyl transferase family protein n=1 Tax=unclassified Micromonospora TaxID=2617518 RepID=UPI002E0F51E2|nr:polysaccharide pyruvyl transferase family protein [Micromonospora sp. NBC_01739]
MARPTVGLICLGEAGNFGDDLIMIAAVVAATETGDDVAVRHLSFGRPVNWPAVSARIGRDLSPQAVRPTRDLPGSRRSELSFQSCQAVLFGGGGLLQTSHHPHTPYHWLSFLPRHHPAVPVLAVGLGLGPLSDYWQRRLHQLGSPFDECYLRDDDSVAYAEQRLGWRVGRCRDFVDSAFLTRLGIGRRGFSADGQGLLGVALRRWPGLDPIGTARHIGRVAEAYGVGNIRLFVLETSASGVDVAFTEQVCRQLGGREADVVPYLGADVLDFAEAMAGCSVAVSMKLHSSALWAALGVPIFPISYAPKTAAFFGQPFAGLKTYDQVVAPAVEPNSVPRAADVVLPWLRQALSGQFAVTRAVLTNSDKLRLQTSRTAVNVYRRLGRSFRNVMVRE